MKLPRMPQLNTAIVRDKLIAVLGYVRNLKYQAQLTTTRKMTKELIPNQIQKIREALTLNSLLSTIISLIGFLYRVFIFVQMCCLGYGESIRIRRYINYILLNCKKIKINPMKQ